MTCDAQKNSPAGEYAVKVSGAEAKNYSITHEDGRLIVSSVPVIVITAKNQTRVYGDANPTLEYTVEGGTLDGTPEISCAAKTDSDVGEYDIVVSQGTVKNYKVEYVGGKLTVSKAPLTVKTEKGTYTRSEGEENPEFKLLYVGLKNGETETVLTKQPTVTCSATKDSPAGEYPVILGGAEAQNYEISYVNGTLDVTEARPSEEFMMAAQELLKQTGVGYPTADSDARKALSELVESGRGTDDVFTKAMDDFYAETDVEMPAVDKYYHIVAITAAKDTAYVNQLGNLTGLVESEAEATPLKLTKGEDGYVLTTADGKQQLNVTIGKKVNAEDAKSVFGLFSIDPFDKMKAIGFTFAEVDKADIPVPEVELVLTPKSGTEVDVLDEVKLTFKGYDKVDLADATKIELVQGETSMNPVVTPVEGSTNEYILTFGIDEPGTYMLLVNKGAFTFDYAELTHETAAVTAKYVVKVPRPTEETLLAAKDLLARTGIGTPAADSKSRTELEALIAAGEGKDEVFEAAMAAFLAETDVEQPANGKYYRVAAVNAKGAEGFVTYEDGKVALTADAENPTVGVFRVTANVDGTLTLSTFDSQYECDVKAARLAIEDASAEETFGLFSLYGTLGAEENAYARANIKDNEWKFNTDSNLDEYLGLMFSDKMTTAFRFTEVAEDDLVVPEVTLAITPADDSRVDDLDEVTFSFAAPMAVALSDISSVSLKAHDGSIVPIVSVESTENVHQLSFINVVAGTYTLEVADSAFTYEFFDKVIPVAGVSSTFTVTKGADFTYDFNVGDMACKVDGEEGREYFMDTALNTLTVGFKNAVTLNPDKTVFVLDEDSVIMVTGHLEAVEGEENVYKFVPDTPIAEGTLEAGTYTFFFEEGMFGDATYAKYLADQLSVLMADCHVSEKLKPFSVKVDNEKAQIPVGILELMNGELSNGKWYDLNGRRVVGKPQKGRVYILNGKKVTL